MFVCVGLCVVIWGGGGSFKPVLIVVTIHIILVVL